MNQNTLTGGFSLIELMLVLTLIAIVAGLAIPSYQSMIGKTRMKAACQQLERAIATARQAAVNHHAEVILCGSQSGSGCDGGWSEGQLIALKHSLKGLCYLPPLPPGITAEWHANLGHNQALEFTPLGISAGQWGSFWLKGVNGGLKSRITVNALGRGAIDPL